jgi:diguanylate cyclase (GGDEF)-like protein
MSGPTVRENAVALSELYRLRIAVQHLVSDGSVDRAIREEVQQALDIVFVRVGHFQRRLALVQHRADRMEAVDGMQAMIDATDALIANDFNDMRAFQVTFGLAAQKAHSALTRIVNEQHIDDFASFDDTLKSLMTLTRLNSGFVMGMVILATGLQLLLRREVLNRKRRSEAEQTATHMAYHDKLTGLGNRALFAEMLERSFTPTADKTALRGTLILVDLERFKDINDIYGHVVGDMVLRHVADGLRACVLPIDREIARLGGDEFAIILQTEDKVIIERMIADMFATLCRQVRFGDYDFAITIAVGYASLAEVTCVFDASPESMVRAADYALQAAKLQMGESKARQFDLELSAQLHRSKARALALEQAIQDNVIEVWLQPQVDLATLQLTGFEALARWCHEGEMIPPDEFIPLAEQSGLIMSLDHYMFRHATRIVAAWNIAHNARARLSVNLSPVHIMADGLLTGISGSLAASGLAPEFLTVELTESVQLREWQTVSRRLIDIQALGCQLSIDDFGSGYSSFGYLRKMPARELKIDRDLVIGIEASHEVRSILAAIVDIARTLKLSIVVEGIETAEQAQIAKALGCTHAQGYFFGKPQRAADLKGPNEVLLAQVATLFAQETGLAALSA